MNTKHTKVTLFTSSVAAGFPLPGDDTVERSLDINELVVKNPTSTFFVKVSGSSMEGAGIFEGDVLVVDRSLTPMVGKIVVAAVYGELVVKRIGKVNGKQCLSSENPDYEPIFVEENDDCFIWGVVVGSVRVFEK